MNKLQLTAIAVLLGTCAAAVNVSAAETTREQRMDQAMKDYQSKPRDTTTRHTTESRRDAGAGPMARGEESVKRGARRAGAAIKSGAHKTGKAIQRGVTKAKNAIRRTGERMGGSSTTPNPNNPATQ